MGTKHMKEIQNQRFSLRNRMKIADGIAEWFGGKGGARNESITKEIWMGLVLTKPL